MTMKQTDTLANIYARSLFELAEASGGRDKILELADELEQVAELLAGSGDLQALFCSPIIDGDRRANALRSIFENRVTDLMLRFMLVLNSNGRLNHFDPIQMAYDLMVQDAFDRVEVDVVTAMPLDESALARVKDSIQQALGKDPVLHPSVDASILGGIQIRVGDQLMDGSVATRLRRLGHRLREQGSHNIRTDSSRFMEDSA
ncbi:MAG: ATP synthase F1 subunit delta [Phycisphaerales bacterium]|nr:ATP synthase F1 subunit delta [Phycisphaerales bacterium]